MLFVRWNVSNSLSIMLRVFVVLSGLIFLSSCAGLAEQSTTKESQAGALKLKQTDAAAVNRAQYDRLSPQAKRNFDAAIVALKNGKNSAAEGLLKKLTKEYPDFYSAPVNLGIVYYKTGRLPEAEGILKSVVNADRQNTVAYNYLGIVYRQAGKFKEAESAYKKALTTNPNYANAHLNLGILYDLYMLDTQKAMDSYKRYQLLAVKQKGKEDKEVNKWLFELKRRKK